MSKPSSPFDVLAQANPFAAMLQGGASNPFAAMLQGGASNPFAAMLKGGASNPFAAMLQGGASNPFAAMLQQPQAGQFAPLLNANRLAVEAMERMMQLQMQSMHAYLELGFGQMKAAMSISDAQSLQQFINGQMEMASTLRQKILDDSRAMADIGQGVKTEIERLGKEPVVHLTAKTAARQTGKPAT